MRGPTFILRFLQSSEISEDPGPSPSDNSKSSGCFGMLGFGCFWCVG